MKFAAILTLFGYLCLIFAIIGGILGIFDYQLVISGSKLGVMDAVTAFIIGGIGVVTLGAGMFLSKRSAKKQADPNGNQPN